mmetsp:Transcript_6766/g.6075  ORF Transcript_6766/g.6075 Transcript_6766/m.6075 type:complete len:506 (+) Transcript_6766:73-1590(+)
MDDSKQYDYMFSSGIVPTDISIPTNKKIKDKNIDGKSKVRLFNEIKQIRKDKKDDNLKRLRSSNTISDLHDNEYNKNHTIQDLVNNIQDSNMHTVLIRLTRLNNLLYTGEVNANQLLNYNIISILSHYLHSNELSITIESLRCLSNIATGDHSQSYQLLSLSTILIQLLNTSNVQVKEECCWLIGNIAGDCDICREGLYITEGIVKGLIEMLFLSMDVSINSHNKIAAWALSNLIRGRTPARIILDYAPLDSFITLLGINDLQLLSEISWVLAFLSAKSDFVISSNKALHIVNIIFQLLDRIDIISDQLIPILRMLSNFLCICGNLNLDVDLLIKFFDKYTNASNDSALIKESLRITSQILESQDNNMKEYIKLNSHLCVNLYSSFLSGYYDLRRDTIAIFRLFFSGKLPGNYYSEEFIDELIVCLKDFDDEVQYSAISALTILLESEDVINYLDTKNAVEIVENIVVSNDISIISSIMLYELSTKVKATTQYMQLARLLINFMI